MQLVLNTGTSAPRFDADQGFTEITAVRLETMDVVDGTWYVSLSGDYAGRVSGAVYDLRNESNPIQLATTVRACRNSETVAMHCRASLCSHETQHIMGRWAGHAAKAQEVGACLDVQSDFAVLT